MPTETASPRARAGARATDEGDRSRALDGARGLAALSVLAFHAWLYTRAVPSASARESPLDYALHELRLGLVLFFVLSGFLLWRPFAAAARGRRPRPGVREYLVRRGARVLPAYLLALTASVVLLYPADGTPGLRLPDPHDLPLFLVFAQNFFPETLMKLDPPMWTLAVEVSFYLLLPVLAVLGAYRLPRGLAWQALVPLGLLALGVWFNHDIAGTEVEVANKLLPAMLPYFAVGMLAALLLDGRAGLGRRAAWALALAGVALVVADAVWQAQGAASRSASLDYRIWRDLAAAIGFAALVAIAGGAARRGGPPRLLDARPLVALGTISYGLYLWHVPVLLLARHLGLLPLQTLPALAIALAATIPIAAASWRWVERPAIERARTATRRWRKHQQTPAAASAH
jgi:peptidoglycan/LPS O-acetylase OafA/YrhL